jgi:flagellar basal-body rod protein FlgG
MVRRRGEAQPQSVATIQLAHFANPGGLEAIGHNLYRPTDASGAAQAGRPGTNGLGKVAGQALEASNVDLSQQVVDLVGAQRAYTLMVRALETSDTMLGSATEMRS